MRSLCSGKALRYEQEGQDFDSEDEFDSDEDEDEEESDSDDDAPPAGGRRARKAPAPPSEIGRAHV